MTDSERIVRLERMVKTLVEACQRLVSCINTGNWEYDLQTVRIALDKVESFKNEEDES